MIAEPRCLQCIREQQAPACLQQLAHLERAEEVRGQVCSCGSDLHRSVQLLETLPASPTAKELEVNITSSRLGCEVRLKKQKCPHRKCATTTIIKLHTCMPRPCFCQCRPESDKIVLQGL